MKFQNPSIHGSEDMRGLKSMTYEQKDEPYGRMNRWTDKPKVICNFEEVEGKNKGITRIKYLC